MSLVVGCPVRGRQWILPRWMDHVIGAIQEADTTAVLLFAVSIHDVELQDFIENEALARAGRGIDDLGFVLLDEPVEPDKRAWDMARYQHMAEIRNRLLAEVRLLAPRFFWSLDSDILVHPKCLASAMAHTKAYDAISMQCVLGRPEEPNWGNLSQGGFFRYDRPGVFQVDVIMASKLMTPRAYNVDYVAHQLGEDAGWSLACRRAGLLLAHDATYRSQHLMQPG